ncbi:MAG: RdgB/HAM1 family non-canonical purine NTP pyrophosphatase [Patescibacteria group bacterium]
MANILFATNNQGKLAEARSILGGLGFSLVSPAEVSGVTGLDVEETGQTFAENALIKAQTFAEISGMLTVADDSGLEVKALDNFPGVKSARWLVGDDRARNDALLERLADIPDDQRQARFVTVLCLFDPSTETARYFEGQIQGKIAREIRGQEGFGYDPLFIPDGFRQTFAEMGQEQKNQLSHRYQALLKLKTRLAQSKT